MLAIIVLPNNKSSSFALLYFLLPPSDAISTLLSRDIRKIFFDAISPTKSWSFASLTSRFCIKHGFSLLPNVPSPPLYSNLLLLWFVWPFKHTIWLTYSTLRKNSHAMFTRTYIRMLVTVIRHCTRRARRTAEPTCADSTTTPAVSTEEMTRIFQIPRLFGGTS